MARSQQRRDDLIPLQREFTARWFAVRLPVPIIRIVEVALDPMQIGVHPSAILIVPVHDDAMRFVPILFGRPPQALQRRRRTCRRRFRPK